MRSRAALLPHPADPFLFKYWLDSFKVWGEEVDKLYILINSPIEKSVIDYMLSLVKDDPKIKAMYLGYQIEHGTALNEMLEVCRESYVLLVEDDGIIFKPGVVDRYFSLLESGDYDVIGSPRGSCGREITEQAQIKFNLDYSGYGDVGANFWPNFFFTRKHILLETDRNFAARAWKKGEKIEPLDYIVEDEVCPGDTFVNTSLQLRAKGYKILEIPQYHGNTNDTEDYGKSTNLFDGKCPWVHVGSLSSGTHGVLKDDYNRPLGRRTIDAENGKTNLGGFCSSEEEKLEWERRVSFWELFLDHYEKSEQDDTIPEFHYEYRKAIDRIVNHYELSPSRIAKRKVIYHTLGL
jgi:hypothetical protein